MGETQLQTPLVSTLTLASVYRKRWLVPLCVEHTFANTGFGTCRSCSGPPGGAGKPIRKASLWSRPRLP